MNQRITAWIGIALAVVIVGAMLTIAFFLPVVQEARSQEARDRCASNLKQIGEALLAYEKDYKTLPPAFTVDSKGNPLHSWRSLILPYLGEKELYGKINFQKGWNDPLNDEASLSRVKVYECSESTLEPGLTSYKAVVDAGAMFMGSQGVAIASCTDGNDKTVMIFESDQSDAVHWMEPQDGTISEFESLSRKRSAAAHRNGHHALMLDGKVRYLTRDETESERKVMVTRSGAD